MNILTKIGFDGRAYAHIPPGYLRVMYPEPELCLDLATWQEFYEFDKNGCVCDLEIDINSEDLTVQKNTAQIGLAGDVGNNLFCVTSAQSLLRNRYCAIATAQSLR